MVQARTFDTKYTNALDGNKAIMLLYGHIGYEYDKDGYIVGGINGAYFADEMYWHKGQGRAVCVYINSPGGMVFDGFNIIQAILDCGATTHCVGMAASMAGVILQFGKYRTMNDFAVGMIHGAAGEDGKLTKMIQEQLKDQLLKNSKLTETEINRMMKTTDPTWLDSSEMLEKGLIDEVVVTGFETNEKIKLQKLNGKVSNINESFEFYTNIVNSLTKTSKNNPTDMEDIKAVGAELGLENASKDAVINKVKELKTASAEKTELTNKLTAAETAKTAAETAKKTAEDAFTKERKDRATELVENAIAAGKVKEESKQSYIDLAITNYDLAKTTLTGIQGATVHNSVLNHINPTGEAVKPAVEDYEELAKNNPAKLAEMAEKEPAKFDALINAYEAKNKKTTV